MDASIIIGTRNRAEHLHQTLQSLDGLVVPPGMEAELIVVDNGSSDDTAAMLAAFPMTSMTSLPLRVVSESRLGQSSARNAGLAASTSDIVLLTDDDLRFPADWLAAMCRPLQSGDADAVAGAVVLAPHLERGWMEPIHRYWLAATEPNAPGKKPDMVGASMALRRAVLDKVPGFDPALGPGALGFCDDTLFSKQLWAAGFTVVQLEEPVVEHHFEALRLTRASLLEAARKRGETKAYVVHHWEHQRVFAPAARMLQKRLEVALWHRRHPEAARDTEGLPPEVLYNLEAYHFYRHYLVESKNPRAYAYHGLRKSGPHSSVEPAVLPA